MPYNKETKQQRQIQWNGIDKFLIKPKLGKWKPIFRRSRKERVIIFRLLIDQRKLIHPFIFKQADQPQCIACQTLPNICCSSYLDN